MTKTLKLVCLLFLALTVVGCGKKAIVPENTIVAAYIDIERAHGNGKDIASTIIGALFADEQSQAKSEYEEVLKKIDNLKDSLKGMGHCRLGWRAEESDRHVRDEKKDRRRRQAQSG